MRQNVLATASGEAFPLFECGPEHIHLEDIATALANTNRFMGHCGAYNNASHSVLVCTIAGIYKKPLSTKDMLIYYLHDAHEAYTADVHPALKNEAYNMCADRIQRIIYEKYLGRDLTPDERDFVKYCDIAALAVEVTKLTPKNYPIYEFDPVYDQFVQEYDLSLPRMTKDIFLSKLMKGL